MVVVVDSGSVSRRASNALIVPLRRKKVEFSAPIWSRRYSEQGPWVSVEASSIPSDPQRRKPDDQTCCDGVRGTINWWRLADLRRWRLEACSKDVVSDNSRIYCARCLSVFVTNEHIVSSIDKNICDISTGYAPPKKTTVRFQLWSAAKRSLLSPPPPAKCRFLRVAMSEARLNHALGFSRYRSFGSAGEQCNWFVLYTDIALSCFGHFVCLVLLHEKKLDVLEFLR